MRYMVHFTFGGPPDDEFRSLIPAEQARIAEMKSQGSLEALHLAADQSQGWLILRGGALAEVEEAAASLPLFKFMRLTYVPLRDPVP